MEHEMGGSGGRLLRFPPDHSLGEIYVGDAGNDAWGKALGPACGAMAVPAGAAAGLVVVDLPPAGLVALAALDPADLQRLDLSEALPRVADAELRHLAHLTGLRSLDLNGTLVTDAGLVQLGALVGLCTLKLAATAVGDAGLARLRPLAALERLDLNATRVTDAGLADLRAFPRLWALKLGGTAVTDAGVEHLAGLVSLRYLNPPRALTSAGLARLHQALPDCRIGSFV